MQSVINSNSKIIERIIHDKSGQLFRAYFLVYEKNGQFFGKLIKVEKIICCKGKILSSDKNFLPISSSQALISNTLYLISVIPSPYFSKIEFFFNSQMTRAPSL